MGTTKIRSDETTGADGIAELDGVEYHLRGVQVEQFIRLLQEAKGKPLVFSRTPLLDQGIRPDRAYKRLQPELQAIIHKPERGHKGYAMRRQPQPPED